MAEEQEPIKRPHVGTLKTLKGESLFVYIRTTPQKVLIVSEKALELLKVGNIIISPDEELILAYSYDLNETSAQADLMLKCTGNVIDGDLVNHIILDGARPKVPIVQTKDKKHGMANSTKKKTAKRRRPKS